MINQFLESWLTILRNCNYDNTYKMAWAKAIVEIAIESDLTALRQDALFQISLKQIAEKVIKYYWNQTIFFNLIQGSNPLKPPKILALTKDLINVYQTQADSLQPIRYERIVHKLDKDVALSKHYHKTVTMIVKALKADVSYRFLNLEGKKVEGIYNYTQGNDSLFMSVANLRTLKDNTLQIFDMINYRWALILETFNSTPRICKKVKIIDEREIRRRPLSRYMKYLDMDNPEHICFICGEKIDANLLSIDHVIPWSYLYSDDIWNLVYTHKSCNSLKSNVVPNENTIGRLEQRNHQLLTIVNNEARDKVIEELRIAVDNNYVHKFWIACHG